MSEVLGDWDILEIEKGLVKAVRYDSRSRQMEFDFFFEGKQGGVTFPFEHFRHLPFAYIQGWLDAHIYTFKKWARESSQT